MRNIIAVLLLAAPVSALAILPDSGWYWNPAESGRGFNIEIQNNLLFAAGFIYDNAGNPLWLTTGGPMSSDRTYNGDLIETLGGQCIGCAYRAPSATKIGNISIAFPTSTTATVTIDGSVLNLRREQFGIDLANPVTPLLGEWAITTGSPVFPVYFGERLTLSSAENTASGPGAFGTRTGDSARTVVGAFIASSGEWGFLVDSSTSYYTIYSFNFIGFNLLQGVSSTFPKGSNPTGTLDSFAHRITSGAAASGQNAPGAKAARAVDLDAADRERAASQTNDKAAVARLNQAYEVLRPGMLPR
jgi:hypothetical protein